MKNFCLLFVFLFLSIGAAQAQRNAPDFEVTDIEGNTHRLYDLLDEGKAVIVDWSATWCSFCWSFHSGHYLEDLYQIYGPTGTGELEIFFYESDPNTNDDALKGISGNTLGDWTAGSTYIFINENPVTLATDDYGYSYNPTVSLIAPNRQITTDLYDLRSQGLAAMKTAVEEAIAKAAVTHISAENMSLQPNPVTDVLRVEGYEGKTATIQIVNINGQVQETQGFDQLSNRIEVPVQHLVPGTYVLLITDQKGQKTQGSFVKK